MLKQQTDQFYTPLSLPKCPNSRAGNTVSMWTKREKCVHSSSSFALSRSHLSSSCACSRSSCCSSSWRREHKSCETSSTLYIPCLPVCICELLFSSFRLLRVSCVFSTLCVSNLCVIVAELRHVSRYALRCCCCFKLQPAIGCLAEVTTY